MLRGPFAEAISFASNGEVMLNTDDLPAIYERQTPVARWLECAEQARAIAETMRTAESKTIMLKTAERYERLADDARVGADKEEVLSS
jgi:hypothetical protein